MEFTEKDGKPGAITGPETTLPGRSAPTTSLANRSIMPRSRSRPQAWMSRSFDAASAAGKTGSDGTYKFDLKLPGYFAGRPLSQGAARALIEATVKDSAGHSETRGEPVTISQSPLLLTAVPEGGTLIPHLDNQVFVLSSYPDGTPAKTTITVHLPGGRRAAGLHR